MGNLIWWGQLVDYDLAFAKIPTFKSLQCIWPEGTDKKTMITEDSKIHQLRGKLLYY